MRWIGLIVVTLAAGFGASETLAQSYNCGRASTPDEVLICQEPGLSRLDEELADLYFAARNGLRGRARSEIEREQSAWLRARMRCGRDYVCIDDLYRDRIAELRTYF
jgi:uncharacterized protein